MSALTDFFTSLANKIRSKLGTSTTYTPAQAVSAIDDVYTKGVTDTKVGTAVAGDVLSGKTFTNSSSVGASGSMTNNGAVSPSGLNCGGSYTIPAGYHNGSGVVTANSLASQTGVDSGKTAVTAGTMVSGYQGWVNGSKITGTFASQIKTQAPSTSAIDVTPDSGKWLSKVTVSAIQTETKTQAPSTSAIDVTPTSGKFLTKVTVSAIPTETKSASPSTSAQTITPTSGKFLTSVSISAISPQRSAGVAATTSGLLNATNLTGYVYFPYGWHPNTNTTYGNYCIVTQAQAQACHYHTGTVTVSTRGASVDIGQLHSYRYVNTNSVPNTNSGTYTPTSNGSALDMGATNSYRYVNTNTVYNQGYTDAKNIGIQSGYLRLDITNNATAGGNTNATCTTWSPYGGVTKIKIREKSGSYGTVQFLKPDWSAVVATYNVSALSQNQVISFSQAVGVAHLNMDVAPLHSYNVTVGIQWGA